MADKQNIERINAMRHEGAIQEILDQERILDAHLKDLKKRVAIDHDDHDYQSVETIQLPPIIENSSQPTEIDFSESDPLQNLIDIIKSVLASNTNQLIQRVSNAGKSSP